MSVVTNMHKTYVMIMKVSC